MKQLKDLQRDFISSVLEGAEDIYPQIKETDGVSRQARMDIYRNNTASALTNALILTFTVVQKLVGEEFFAAMAREYIKDNHPNSGNLDDYGENFVEFLESFEPVQKLIYLPDVARLEWLFHQSSIAPEAALLDATAFAAIPQDKYFALKLYTNPSLQLINSKYPIHKIWEMNQIGADSDMQIDLDVDGGASLMVLRKYLKTDIITIRKAEEAFLRAISNDGNFYNAFEMATDIDSEFDLAYYLSKHIQSGAFSGFAVET